MGDRRRRALRVQFDRRLRLDCLGAKITSEGEESAGTGGGRRTGSLYFRRSGCFGYLQTCLRAPGSVSLAGEKSARAGLQALSPQMGNV